MQNKDKPENKQFDPANKQHPSDPNKRQFGGQENAGTGQQQAQKPGQDFGQQRAGQGDKMNQQADEQRKDGSQQQGGQGKSEQR
jgi:hypothetical protein